MKKEKIVIKIGGHELSSGEHLAAFAEAVVRLQKQFACALVHGGGKSISDLMTRLDVAPVFVNGQRVTDAAALDIAEMVLSGQVNKRIVLELLLNGLDALGLSGIDRGLLRVEAWSEDMPLVGRIVEVRSSVLEDLLAQNVIPVISPISYGPAGRYNVNADHAAGAVAGAIGAKQVIFISNVPGILVDEKLLPQASEQAVEEWILSGKIFGGMIPKVSAAQAALHQGAKSAVITNLAGLLAGSGTVLTVAHGEF